MTYERYKNTRVTTLADDLQITTDAAVDNAVVRKSLLDISINLATTCVDVSDGLQLSGMLVQSVTGKSTNYAKGDIFIAGDNITVGGKTFARGNIYLCVDSGSTATNITAALTNGTFRAITLSKHCTTIYVSRTLAFTEGASNGTILYGGHDYEYIGSGSIINGWIWDGVHAVNGKYLDLDFNTTTMGITGFPYKYSTGLAGLDITITCKNTIAGGTGTLALDIIEITNSNAIVVPNGRIQAGYNLAEMQRGAIATLSARFTTSNITFPHYAIQTSGRTGATSGLFTMGITAVYNNY